MKTNVVVAKAPDSRSDVELVQAFIRGEEQAFDEIVRRYKERLLDYVLHYVNDDDQAEDVVQDTFIKVFLSIHAFRQDQAFSHWIIKITQNMAISQWRKVQRRQIADTRVVESEIIDKPETTFHDILERKESLEFLLSALERLDPENRVILKLFYLEERGHAEIAETMGFPVGTSRWRLSLARQALRNIISPQLL